MQYKGIKSTHIFPLHIFSCISLFLVCLLHLKSKFHLKFALKAACLFWCLMIFFTEQGWQESYLDFKIVRRSFLRSFSGCLCSSGPLHGMGGILVDQTRDLDLEDNLVRIWFCIHIYIYICMRLRYNSTRNTWRKIKYR